MLFSPTHRKPWVSWWMTAICSITTWGCGLFLWIELESGSSGPLSMWPQSRVIQAGSHSQPPRQFTQTWRSMTRQKRPVVERRNGEGGVIKNTNWVKQVRNGWITGRKIKLGPILNMLVSTTWTCPYPLPSVIPNRVSCSAEKGTSNEGWTVSKD